MDLVFPQGKSVEISFKVGIAGTAVSPQSVFVSLARDGKITSFNATKVGDEYKALIEYPGHMLGVGDVDFSINVKVNDRIFTPFKSVANVVATEIAFKEIEPEVTPEIAVEVTTEEKIEPTIEPTIEPAIAEPKPKQITAKDLNFEAKPEIVKPAKKSLMKMIEPVQAVKPIQPTILKPKVAEDTAPKFSIKKLKVIFK